MAVTLGLRLGRQQRVVETLGNWEAVAAQFQTHVASWECSPKAGRSDVSTRI